MAFEPTGERAQGPSAIEWPRTYPASRAERLRWGRVAAMFAAVGVVFLVWASRGGAGGGPRPMVLTGLLLLLLAGVFLLRLLALRSARVVLWDDAIEFVEWRGRRCRFSKSELAGQRSIAGRDGQGLLVLEFRNGRKPFRRRRHWTADEAFTAWLAALPDLDAAERGRLEAELLKAPALGRSEDERRASLRRARRAARLATGAGVALLGWGLVWPRPYALAIGLLAAAPVAIGIVLLLGRGAYSLEGERNDPRPNLLFPLLAPGFVLLARAAIDLRMIDWTPPALWTAPAAIAATLALRACDPRALRRWYLVPLFALMLAPWAWGSMTLGNAVLDRAPGETFEAHVVGKRVSHGRHTAYLLELTPWGPVTEEDEVDVGRRRYERTAVGDGVCPRLRPGALGFRWFTVEACRGE